MRSAASFAETVNPSLSRIIRFSLAKLSWVTERVLSVG